MRRLARSCVIPLLPLALALAEEKSAFDIAMIDAKRNVERAGGHAFENAVGKAFGESYGTRVSTCAKRVVKPDLRDFEILIRLAINGRVEEALVRPETNLASCVQTVLKEEGAFPPPVTPGYWVRIGLKLKR